MATRLNECGGAALGSVFGRNTVAVGNGRSRGGQTATIASALRTAPQLSLGSAALRTYPSARRSVCEVGDRHPPAQVAGHAPDRPLEHLAHVALDGFTLHAATRAGALDAEGREALLRYVPTRRATSPSRAREPGPRHLPAVG